MRERGMKDTFESAHSFLDTEWQTGETRRIFAEVTWGALGLPGEVPMAALERNESWRLLLDAEGVGVYERAIAHKQPKFVHRLDLIQLVYLGLAPRRMIVTADRPLLRAANEILTLRYPNARAIHISDLVS